MSIVRESTIDRYRKWQPFIRDVGEKALVFAAAGSGLGVVMGSIPIGGIGVATGAIAGLGVGLLESRKKLAVEQGKV